MEIFIPIAVLGVLGLVLGLIIGICNKFLQVKHNPYIDEVYKLLPQINCGLCGNPSCMAMAEEILENGVSVNNCRPCKSEKKDIIEKCPDISVNMIEYHLKELLEQEFIKKVKSGRYSSYIRIIK